MVPLNYNGDLMVDLAPKISTATFVVFKNYLGSINHTILTIEQLKSKGVNIFRFNINRGKICFFRIYY